MNKVILILIDGLGSDYFAKYRSQLNYLDQLASNGIFIERMPADIPGTSMPGRASIITGVDTATHGVYGNNVLDGDQFRPVRSTDIKVPNIARKALLAGRDVVGLGFGMLSPEDTNAYVDPWWEHIADQGLTNLKITSEHGPLVAPIRKDPSGRIASKLRGSSLSSSTQTDHHSILHPQMLGMLGDHSMMRLTAELACSDNPPDLILTEISVTDVIEHYHGCDSEAAHWALATADMEVGLLLHKLEKAGRRDDYLIIVTSDHGHGAIKRAIYPDSFIPHSNWATEGASLHVRIHNPDELREIEQRFMEVDVKALPGTHLPESIREKIVTFVAPSGSSFEQRPDFMDANAKYGDPVLVSTHGLAPGAPEDDHICIFAGKSVKPGKVSNALSSIIAPTIAKVLGLPGVYSESIL